MGLAPLQSFNMVGSPLEVGGGIPLKHNINPRNLNTKFTAPGNSPETSSVGLLSPVETPGG